MKHLLTAVMLVCILATGNPADFIQVIVNGVDRGDHPTPMAYSVDYLPKGTHHITLIPHSYVEHVPVQVDMELRKRENKKFEFWQIIPQPGDEEYFSDTLKIKVKK